MILHFAESKNDGCFYMKEPIAIASIYLVKKINKIFKNSNLLCDLIIPRTYSVCFLLILPQLFYHHESITRRTKTF
jgi:hypothetical protein